MGRNRNERLERPFWYDTVLFRWTISC